MGLDYFSRYSYLLRISLDDMLLFAEVAIYKMPYIKKKNTRIELFYFVSCIFGTLMEFMPRFVSP